MRLIDADALKQFEIIMPRGDGYSDFVFAGHIDQAPTIDAVPVVRCRDCKYYWKNNSKYKSNMEDLDDLMMCLASPKDDAFCSEGERKTDA